MKFSTASEVRHFEDLISHYEQERGIGAFNWISLADAFVALGRYSNGGRIFAMLLDLRLNVLALQQDLGAIAELSNSLLRRESPSSPVWSTAEELFPRLDLLRLNTSMILRYRAILDKVMAILVMLAAPEEYEAFAKARSRRKRFVKLAADGKRFPKILTDHLVRSIDVFDRKYRTPEAHGTGAVRKWIFLEEDKEERQSDMFWAWNSLHPLLTLLGRIFEDVKAENGA